MPRQIVSGDDVDGRIWRGTLQLVLRKAEARVKALQVVEPTFLLGTPSSRDILSTKVVEISMVLLRKVEHTTHVQVLGSDSTNATP
jgi:hypothetical protein